MSDRREDVRRRLRLAKEYQSFEAAAADAVAALEERRECSCVPYWHPRRRKWLLRIDDARGDPLGWYADRAKIAAKRARDWRRAE